MTVGWGKDERIADLYFEDRTSEGAPSTEGLVRLVSNRLRGLIGGALRYLDVQVSSATPTSANRTASAAGSSEDAARADHRHGVDVALPTTLSAGGSNTLGSSTSLAPADHVHRIDDPTSIVTSTGLTTTTSATFSVVSGMTITPGAGTYLATFSCYGRAQQPQTGLAVGLAVDGSDIAHTERIIGGTAQSLDAYFSLHTQAKITISASQTVQARFRSTVAGYTSEVANRSLLLQRVDA